MRTNLSVLKIAAVGVLFVGCDRDNKILSVDPVINDAFRLMYANTSHAEWEIKQGYYVVDFWQNGVEAEAWFDSNGMWYMTETDVKWANLHAAVQAAFSASEWAGWRIDDIDKLEYPDRETAYVIEVEQAGSEYDLWISPDGVLVKAVSENGANTGNQGTDTGTGGGNDTETGTGGSSHTPSQILPAAREFITHKYPGARIIDIETERNSIEVDIVDGNTPREVVFTLAGEWSHTETEVRKAGVPAAILSALAASEYGSWHIDDISHFETPGGEYFLFEVESGNRESHVKIDMQGKIV